MKQVFIETDANVNQKIMLNEKEAHHLFDVLRTSDKETIRVVTNTSQVFLARVQQKPYIYLFDKMTVEQKAQHITLCCSLIKQDKFEWMLQKACELGVTRIVPFESRYSVVQLDEKKQQKKLERWSSIILASCKQCNRNDLVELTPIQKIETLKEFQSECNLVAYEKEDDPSKHLAAYLEKDPESITICIGPEGGFDEKEIEKLKNDHFSSCSLGKNILRAETAACYILSCIEYQTHWGKEN